MHFTDFCVVTILDYLCTYIPHDAGDDLPCIIQIDDPAVTDIIHIVISS